MMAEDGGSLSGDPGARDTEGRSSVPRTFIRLNDLSGAGGGGGVERSEMEPVSAGPDGAFAAGEEASAGGEDELPHPTLAPVVFFYLKQTTPPRSWCLKMLSNVFLNSCVSTWFERASMLVILLNCVTLGMFQPCEDHDCESERCKILEDFDDFIFAFFAVEMVIKMVALGIFGKKCYLGDTWNRLDFFIVLAGMLEYSLNLENVSFSAVRTVRVLRPLRAINRVPSMRILVTLLLDTLPMLGNVLLLCFFVFFIFGIVGVQLWAGLLRNRCFLPENFSLPLSIELETYYHTEKDDESPFICSMPRENGMRLCSSVPTLYEEGGLQCQVNMKSYNSTDNTTCINWYQYYSNCSAGHVNPFKGAINFDNICYAWIAIFQVITLEGWVDIMYFVMDSHSFYNFIYFILLIIIGSFFMINLCLVVIATQFSETKQRESQLMREQRVRFLSNASTLASFSEPGSCYDELLKLLVHVIRNGFRQVAHVCRAVMRRAGMNIAASPPALERERERGSQRKRRKTSRQGSVVSTKGSMSVHYLVHQHHHHHHHYHLLNGSVRGRLGGRGVAGVGGGGGEVEMGSHSNNGGTGRLMLGPLPLPTSDLNLANPVSPANPAPGTGKGNSSSVRSTLHTECHLEPSTPTLLAPTTSPISLAPTPMSRPMKRNSVPFAGPRPKNYPTLQPSTLMEFGSGSVPASTISNINLNISSLPLVRGPPSVLDTHTPTAQLSRHDLSAIGTLDPSFTFDPESCPYCVKALSGESEGTDGNETPGESDSEGFYEFTQDLHHRDRRDSRQPGKRQRKLGSTVGRVVRAWRLVCDTFRKIVDSKYFGRGIMIAILINTLSMGIEFHEQGDWARENICCKVFHRQQFPVCVKNGPPSKGTFSQLDCGKHLSQQGVASLWNAYNTKTESAWNQEALFDMFLHGVSEEVTDELAARELPKDLDSLIALTIQIEGRLREQRRERKFDFTRTHQGSHLAFESTQKLPMVSLPRGPEAPLPEPMPLAELDCRQRTCAGFFFVEKNDKILHPCIDYLGLNDITVKNRYPLPLLSFEPLQGATVTHALRPADTNQLFVKVEKCEFHRSTIPLSGLRHLCWECPDLSREALTSPKVPFTWSPAADRAFRDLKYRFTPVPILVHPDSSSQFVVEVDASDIGVGAVLSQRSALDLKLHPCVFFSHRLNVMERNYDVEKSEASRSEDGIGEMELMKLRLNCQLFSCGSLNYYGCEKGTFRMACNKIITHKMFDHIVLVIIFLNCITIAMERPRIEAYSVERIFLTLSNYIFTAIFVAEMTVKVAALGWLFGDKAYLRSSWNLLDGMLVMISAIDILVSLVSNSSPKILGMLRVLRLLRTLRPLRVISRAPGLKLVVETLMSSLKPIGNIVVICCAFFIIFGILGVQLFKGKFFACQGEDVRNVTNKSDCMMANYKWVRQQYNFDNLAQALMSLFVLASKDGWVDIMYDGLDAVGVDQQPQLNHNPWMLLYFISFLLIVSFFVLNMFVGVVVENFHKCRRSQEAEEAKRREEKRLKRMEKKRRSKEKEMAVSLLIQGSMEGELSLIDNLPGSVCHYYALPPLPSKHCSDKKIPLAEMEGLSLATDKSWSLALSDDSTPDDINPLFLTSLESKMEILDPGEPLEDNLLSVRKSTVGRTHSLPNDSYMFLPLELFGSPGAGLGPGLASQTQTTGPQHIETINKALSGSCTSLRTQPDDRPSSPHSLSHSQSIHTLSRTLRRQVAISNDSQEVLCSDGGEGEEVVLHVASLALSSSSSSPSHLHQQPALQLVPATPVAIPQPWRPSSVHTQHPSSHSLPPPPLPPTRPWRQEEASADQEVSLITRAGLAGIDNVIGVGLGSEDGGLEGSYKGYWVGRGGGQLKRFHSADTQGRSVLAPRSHPLSWLDDPRRHSVEVCSSVESSPQRSTASSGFVSRADSLQIHSQTTTHTLPSPRRKKKMSPPCISVDPPDGLELQSGLHPAPGGGGGLGMPPPLHGQDTSCLRRRAPSSDSKDSFDLGVEEGLGLGLCQEGGGSNPNPKLLTLPSFSFEKTSSEH
ncbi:LOW QUALITY PROTEIN: voltage-dependent T-type calcium channel subunit alpha-1G-like [Salvelinus alpinus]